MTTSRAGVAARAKLTRLAESGADAESFRRDSIRCLRRVIGFDAWCWATADPLSGLPTGGLADNPSMAGAQRDLFALEFGTRDVNDARSLAETPRVVRLRAATGGVPGRSRRFAELLGPRGVGDELRAGITTGGECWGHLTLYRGSDCTEFTAAEEALMTPLLHPWVQRHRSEVRAGLEHQPAHQSAGGVLILDDQHHPIAQSATAAALLAALPQRPPGPPLCLTALGAWLSVHPGESATARLPVRDRSGRWQLAQAYRLSGAVPAGSLAVTLSTATPAELAPLAMAAARLTSREREITTLVLAGLSTAVIAATLHLAPYTVQDHLRGVFAKFEVHERRELAARLLYPGDPDPDRR